MALANAIAGLAVARGMKPAELADAIKDARTWTTLYRVLRGETADPRISTLLEVCRTLHTSPNELLGLAGMWPQMGRLTMLDIALRQAFREMQELSEEDRRLLLGMPRGVVKERNRDRPARRRMATRAQQPTGGRGDSTA
jgi:DNA-binding Xre family transcriptional regulator